MRRISAVAAATALLFSAAPLLAAEEQDLECTHVSQWQQRFAASAGFDEKTGLNPDHFPAERSVDIEHIRLEMDFPSLDAKKVSVVETIILSAAFGDLDEVELDAEELSVASVQLLSEEALKIAKAPVVENFPAKSGLEFFANESTLKIALPETLKKGGRIALRIAYTVYDPEDGLTWIEPLPSDPDPRWEVWSQGETDGNHHWFATHDYPNDRHTSEIIARVPSPNIVSAAGKLLSRKDNGDGSSTFHWRMDVPHVSYLTTIIVGQYDVQTQDWRGVPVEYYVPPQNAADSLRTFSKTPQMMEVFSRLFDEPYPFPRYAQIVVREFRAGGMENISATTMTSRLLQGEASDRYARGCAENREYLIAHELGHQWFGDLMTCRNWSHTWLNEGWASYCEDLWAEASCGADQYDYAIWDRRNDVARADGDGSQPVVYVRAPDPGVMFGTISYKKGGYVLHMLRQMLGDDAFFAGVAAYIDKHKHGVVVTEDLRAALEEKSGRDLEAMFRQWLYTSGTPRVTVSLDYSPTSRIATVDIEQTQTINAEHPAFRGDLDLHFVTTNGAVVEQTVSVTERHHSLSVFLDSAPAVFAPDPKGKFLMELKQDVPTDILVGTLRYGPTTLAKLTAITALRDKGTSSAIEALRAAVEGEATFFAIREEAANALGVIEGDDAAHALHLLATKAIAGTPDAFDWRVRQTIASGLGGHADDADCLGDLLQLINDPSEPVARAATGALGKSLGPEAADALLKAFNRRGEHDLIAEAALESLVQRGDPGALTAAIRTTGSDFDYRVRPGGVSKIGDILESTTRVTARNEGISRLLELLNDPRDRIRQRAMGALGKTRYAPGVVALRPISEMKNEPELAESARNAIKAIETSTGSREDVRQLQDQLSALEKRLEKIEGKKPKEKAEDKSGEKKKRRRFLGIF